MARKKRLPKYQGYTRSEIIEDPDIFSPNEVQGQTGGFFRTSDPEYDMDILNYSGDRLNMDFDPNEKDREVFTRYAQTPVGGNSAIDYPMPVGTINWEGIKRNGGEVLSSFKSASRLDQPSYKKNPGRRTKG